MLNDLRFAFRSLAKTPGFTAVALLTLALGLGGGTAMFSIVNAVLLRPLALPEPGRLVFLQESIPAYSAAPLPVNAAHFQAWCERSRSFSALGVAVPTTLGLSESGETAPVAVTYATPGLLPALGLTPVQGRGFTASDESSGAGQVVLLSDRLWRSRYQADPGIVGRTVFLDRTANTVIGVLPPAPALRSLDLAPAGFAGPDFVKLHTFASEELAERWGRHNYAAYARLRTGVSAADARRELDALAVQLAREADQKLELRAVVTPLQERIVAHSRRGLLLLAGSVASVLLIGCINLAALLLARAEQRRAETALRAALGATRSRILRLALLEPLLIALLGGALGLFLADALVQLLPLFAPADLPRLGEAALDAPLVLFGLGLALACGLLTGLAPAWQLARRSLVDEIGGGGRSVAGSHRAERSQRAFVVVQIALSVVLLTGAALLGRSLHRLVTAEQGYHAPGALAAQVLLPSGRYDTDARKREFYARVLERLAAMPDIEAAALANRLPLQGETWVDKIWLLGDGRTEAQRPSVNTRMVSPDYFRTIGLPVVSGRTFLADDNPQETVIVSRQLARLLWPDQDPVGRRLTRNGKTESVVIGVAADVRTNADRAPVPTLYRPFDYWPLRRTNLIARPRAPGVDLATRLRDAVRTVDPEVPLASFQTLTAIAAGSVAPQRFQASLASAFAVIATLLTALGLYGTVAYAVACRSREFGVRLALGATPEGLPREVVRRHLRPVACGLAVGALFCLSFGHLLEEMLFETAGRDPFLLAGVALLVVLIAALASWLPARRAARVDPLIALRAE
ncbi:MAG: hypothetical protein C0502_06990 [Opitutus sp.]|nr:hypothetical protein [Opitutus sp.]